MSWHKYRITVVKHENKVIYYYAQRRFLYFFWRSIEHVYVGEFANPKQYASLSDAEKVINLDKIEYYPISKEYIYIEE